MATYDRYCMRTTTMTTHDAVQATTIFTRCKLKGETQFMKKNLARQPYLKYPNQYYMINLCLITNYLSLNLARNLSD